MIKNNINPFIRWWVTPKLPIEDIQENHNFFTKWITHPIKRRIARLYLKFLQKFTSIIVIGVTGSSGKSTTVQMIASILSNKGKTLATPPSIDPVYNIPNTILKCLPGTKFLVLEMSVEYQGEMDYYLWLAQPDIGLIINIYPTHVKFLKDVDGVVYEKGKLVTSLSSHSHAVLNKDSYGLKRLSNKVLAKVSWFNSDINPLQEDMNAAKAVAKVLNMSDDLILQGLSSYKKPKHRFEFLNHKTGSVIFDDTYNSNPKAASMSLEYFNKLAKGRVKICVIGDMLELGDIEVESHRELGYQISKSNFSVVIGVGKLSHHTINEIKKQSRNTKTFHVEKSEDAYPLLKNFLGKDVYVFMKGSRGIHLENIVSLLFQ